jgi:TatD DNase family protein
MADRHNRDIDRQPAPLPEPINVKCVDSHAHLEIVTNTSYDSPEIGKVISDAASVGIDRIVQVGYSAEQSEWGVKLAERWPKILAAVALHPNEAPVVKDLEADIGVIAGLATHPKVRAIGETGLDFFRTELALQDKQIYSFKRHIEIAKSVDKALVIHDRDAHRAVLDTLIEVGAPTKTIFHCFSGDAQMARECIEKGYILSFAGTVTFKNAPQLREALKLVPDDQLLVETDSPFLCPMPNRGALNTPAQIPTILRFMAQVRSQDLDELCAAISLNNERLFGSFN